MEAIGKIHFIRLLFAPLRNIILSLQKAINVHETEISHLPDYLRKGFLYYYSILVQGTLGEIYELGI